MRVARLLFAGLLLAATPAAGQTLFCDFTNVTEATLADSWEILASDCAGNVTRNVTIDDLRDEIFAEAAPTCLTGDNALNFFPAGAFEDARISESSVTQHEAALTVTESQVSDLAHVTQEEIEDFAGAMVSGNTETGITVTYEDGDGTLDFVVSTVDVSAGTNLAVTAPVTLTDDTVGLTQNAGTDVTADLEEETHATEHASGGGDAVDHDTLTNFAAAEHVPQRQAATDCTAETGGATGEICQELDDNSLFVCETGPCDGSGWVAYAAGSGITAVVEDATPQLGGDLDVNGQAIVSVSNGDIDITPDGTGEINLNGPVNTQASPTPTIAWKDSDATAGDDNATAAVNCTDVGDGTEDCDLTLSVQVAGAATARVTVDADGNTEIPSLTTGGAAVSTGSHFSPSTLEADYGAETLSSTYTVQALVDFDSGTEGTLRLPASATLPATCTLGDTYWDTDGDTDGSLYVCRATDTWKEVDDDAGGGSSGSVYFIFPHPPAGADGALSGNNTADDDQIYCTLFNVSVEMTDVDTLRYWVTTAPSEASEHIEWGIYSEDGQTQYFESRSTNPTTGIKTLTNDIATPAAMTPGSYWQCHTIDSGVNATVDIVIRDNGASTLTNGAYFFGYTTATATAGELPDTLPNNPPAKTFFPTEELPWTLIVDN